MTLILLPDPPVELIETIDSQERLLWWGRPERQFVKIVHPSPQGMLIATFMLFIFGLGATGIIVTVQKLPNINWLRILASMFFLIVSGLWISLFVFRIRYQLRLLKCILAVTDKRVIQIHPGPHRRTSSRMLNEVVNISRMDLEQNYGTLTIGGEGTPVAPPDVFNIIVFVAIPDAQQVEELIRSRVGQMVNVGNTSS